MSIYGFDLEFYTTNGFRPFANDSYIICSSWCGPNRNSVPEFCLRRNSHTLQNLLSLPSTTIVGHNLGAADIIFWEAAQKKLGLPVRSIKAKPFCTMVAQTLIDENIPHNSLEYLAKKYLKEQKSEIDVRYLHYYDIEDVRLYNMQDAWLSRRLYEPLMQELQDNDLLPIFNILMEVMNVLVDIELRGVAIDFDWLNTQGQTTFDEILKVFKQIQDFCGFDLNPDSNKQLSEFLYYKLKFPILKRSAKTHKPSCDAETITKLSTLRKLNEEQKNFLDLLLSYRKLNKYYTTYLHPLANRYIGFDKRCHSLYYVGRGTDEWHRKSIYGAKTGRLASREPNLQNQPNDPGIKGCYIPSPGDLMFKGDYAQLEMRVAGYLSKDPELQEAFKADLDIHTYVLSLIRKEPYDKIMQYIKEGDSEYVEARRNIKPYNFAMIYGASWPVLQNTMLTELGIWVPEEEVKANQKAWKKVIKGVVDWQKNVHTIIDVKRRVVSSTGRVRRFRKGPADWKDIRDWRKQGFNAIIQSLAVDITLIAMLQLDKELESYDAHLLFNVHDSLEGEYKPDTEEDLRDSVNYCFLEYPKIVLEEDFGLDVSDLYLKVDLETGLERWK